MGQHVISKVRGRHLGINACKVTDLFGDNRADAGKAGVDCLGDPHGLSPKCPGEVFICSSKRILLFHRIRDEVRPSRQNLPHGAHLSRHVLDTVDDLVLFVAEDDVAVFPHDLDDQCLLAQVAKLVQMLDPKLDDPLEAGL